MKRYVNLLCVFFVCLNIISGKAQITPPSIKIEYIDLLVHGTKIPEIKLSREELILIMKGSSRLYIYVDNAPASFKSLGDLKKDKKESKLKNMVAFDVTDLITKRYSKKKDRPVSIIGPGDTRVRIETEKKKQGDWEDE